jgi:formylglycine-generating enzyme required for sulfatase activity
LRVIQITILNLLALGILSAQNLNVHTTDGQVFSFELGEIESISFSDNPADEIQWQSIPAGDFSYGPDDQVNSDLDYDYEMMRYEVTNAQYVAYLIAALDANYILVTGSGVEGVYPGDDVIPSDQYTFYKFGESGSRISWTGESFAIEPGYALHPVTEVTWFGAWDFADFNGFRLPTEMEWEKAARSNTGFDYPWGDSSPDCDQANHLDCVGDTQAIEESTGASPFELADLCGNVAEWTSSSLEVGSFYKVFRGGSYLDDGDPLKSWYRDSTILSNYLPTVGFRCAR